MSAQTPSRQPAGVPIGGQFAATIKPEANVTLAADLLRPMATPNAADNRPAGLRTPEAETVFDAIWAGKASGFSEVQVTASRAENLRLLGGLRAKTIPPRHIVGTGYKKGRARPIAEEWLTRQITADDAALATRGRSDTVNQGNVRFALRRADTTGVKV